MTSTSSWAGSPTPVPASSGTKIAETVLTLAISSEQAIITLPEKVEEAVPSRFAETSMPLPLGFEISRQPISEGERSRFAPDLESLGLDHAVWSILNASLAVAGPHSEPHMLRAYRGEELVGALFYMSCRRQGRCVTHHPIWSRALDLNSMPAFLWNRLSAGMDHHTNPGFVAGGLERQTLIDTALEFLTGRYTYGVLIDHPEIPTRLPSADIAHLDYGYIDTANVGVKELLRESKNLKRKTRKFTNKGGRIDVIEGPMPAAERETVARWIEKLDPAVRLGFQDAYPAMVAAGLMEAPTVHMLAYLDGVFVGNQSFVRVGSRLVCLSGIFDQQRTSNYHAYENIILTSVEYARERELEWIEYGPIVNPTKARLMTSFMPSALRYYSRFAPVRRGLSWLVHRSLLSPEVLRDFIGLEPQRG